MNHSFDIEHAASYGLPGAVLIGNFQFWIAKNKANGLNFRDGRTWTYNSVAAFAELFPYLTENQIRRSLESLVKAGVLVEGCYNERAADRTKWYAFFDESIFIPSQIHLANLPNGNGKRAKSVNKADVNDKSKPDGDAQRGSRLAADWILPKSWGEWALTEFKDAGWTEEYVRKVADKFKDHWIAKPGKDGRKSEWLATWRNWCRGEPGPKKEGSAGTPGWWASESGILAKGREFGLSPGRGEALPTFQARIRAVIENGGKPPAPTPSRLPQPYTPLAEDGGTDAPGTAPGAARKHLTNLKQIVKKDPPQPKPKDPS